MCSWSRPVARLLFSFGVVQARCAPPVVGCRLLGVLAPAVSFLRVQAAVLCGCRAVAIAKTKECQDYQAYQEYHEHQDYQDYYSTGVESAATEQPESTPLRKSSARRTRSTLLSEGYQYLGVFPSFMFWDCEENIFPYVCCLRCVELWGWGLWRGM